MNQLQIVALCGSLRKASYNGILLDLAVSLAPESMNLKRLSLEDIPLFSQDVEEEGFPESVKLLRESVRHADGLLIACPEYNNSVSGVLKNAIDWISRKDEAGYPFSRKPIMIVGATTGLWGTARAQKELRSILNNLNTFPMNKPELFVSEAETKLPQGGPYHPRTVEVLGKMLVSFEKWIEVVKQT